MTTIPNLNPIPAVTGDDYLITHDITTNRSGRVSAASVKTYVKDAIIAAGDITATDIPYDGSNVAAHLNRAVKTVVNYAALSTTVATIGQQVELSCHTTIGDGGGGLFDVISSTGLIGDTGTLVINGAAAFKRVISKNYRVAWFGAPTDMNDASTHINNCILAAYKAKATVLSPTDEVYSVEVEFDGGKDYRVFNPILWPSGIVLNGNGCRLVGNFPSGGVTAYNDAQPSIIETATYNGTAMVTNRSAAIATYRVVGAGIKNFAFLNANCAINAINVNEQSYIDHCTYNNVSAPLRLKACFYLKVNQHISRNSAIAAGQPAVHLHGGNHNNMELRGLALAGCAIGIAINGPASFATTIRSCTFEESTLISGIGLLFGADAYCGGWDISNNYFEGVRYGFRFDNGCGLYGGNFTANMFNSCEYSFLASSAQNALRMVEFSGNSIPDDGGIIRNLCDISAVGNDVIFHLPGISSNTTSGPTGFLTNIITNSSATAKSTSVWKKISTGAAIAKAQPATANQNKLNILPFEGANIVTTANEVPFCYAPVINPTTAVLDTNLVYDASNMLVFNFLLADFVGSYPLHGSVFGSTVYRKDSSSSVTIAITNNTGLVRVTFGGITTTGGSFTLSGNIRHY